MQRGERRIIQMDDYERNHADIAVIADRHIADEAVRAGALSKSRSDLHDGLLG